MIVFDGKCGNDVKSGRVEIISDFIVFDVGALLDTFATHSENVVFDIFRSWAGDRSARPQGAIVFVAY